MSARMKAYQFLVNRVPEIQKEYWRRRKLHKRPAQRAADWCALLGMNLAWTFGFRSWAADDLNPDAKRILPKEAESALHEKLPPEEFAKKLLAHDVISFDVFDTLVLRPFERPTDLFHIVGARLEYLDFARLRVEAETKARQRKFKKEETYEVTLEEIWDVVEEDAGIPKSVGMPVEIETELAYCFGNPYMLEVFRYLEGARIICTSDMYLSSVLISEMLEKCGFRGISRIYVSNEQGASKSDGSLYRKVKKELERECDSARKGGSPLAFAHTGDNRVSDVEKAKEAGWAANHYPNVNDLGEWYRARDLSAVTGSLYRGIVNARLHNGLHTYSKEYELGYVYGGLFVTGYCQWIHRYAREHGIDQILFLARDGDILYRAYRRMYAEEMDGPDLQYVYWSRLAATKLGAGYFKYDFFRRFLHHKVNQGYTLQEIFAGMELEELLAGCLEKTGFSETTRLISANEDKVEKYLKQNWQQVLDIYQGQREAAGIYYRKSLEGHRRVAAVDVGWAGSGAVVLSYLAKEEWHLPCEIVGLLAGTNSAHNGMEKDTAEGLRYAGRQASYLYSQEVNRDIWKFHDAAKGHNLLWELLLSSSEGSLKGFYLTGNGGVEEETGGVAEQGRGEGYEIRLGKAEELHARAVEEIQSGILDFLEDWLRLEKAEEKLGLWSSGNANANDTGGLGPPGRAGHEISGADVYAVMKLWCDEANKGELERLFDEEGI